MRQIGGTEAWLERLLSPGGGEHAAEELGVSFAGSGALVDPSSPKDVSVRKSSSTHERLPRMSSIRSFGIASAPSPE